MNKPNNQGVAVYIRDFGMLYTQMNLAMKTYISSERSCKNKCVLHIALFIYFRYKPNVENAQLAITTFPNTGGAGREYQDIATLTQATPAGKENSSEITKKS